MKISRMLVAFTLLWFTLSPMAQAIVPAPDGCYPNLTTAEGCDALSFLTTGGANTALGWRSLFFNTTGSSNTGVGAGALALNTEDNNVAVGTAALLLNTIGHANTATGTGALLDNDRGNFNVANGTFALTNNTTGDANTAIGTEALVGNTTGNNNTAAGDAALFSNTTGGDNTAVGSAALFFNAGSANTAVGRAALLDNTTDGRNTAIGFQALTENEGERNTAVGYRALALCQSCDNDVAIGHGAGSSVTSANNVICIGANVAGANISDSCYIGNIHGNLAFNDALPVYVGDSGRMGTALSARRFKRDIQRLDNASEAILALKPVTFHYKSDPKLRVQFGLIAEEVAEVNPDLVVRDKNGDLLSVRYDQVNAMLLNEFIKEHRKVENLEAALAQQKTNFESRFAAQQKQIEVLTAGLQKVSAQLEVSKPAPQTVLND